MRLRATNATRLRRSSSGHASSSTGGCARCCTNCTTTGPRQPVDIQQALHVQQVGAAQRHERRDEAAERVPGERRVFGQREACNAVGMCGNRAAGRPRRRIRRRARARSRRCAGSARDHRRSRSRRGRNASPLLALGQQPPQRCPAACTRTVQHAHPLPSSTTSSAPNSSTHDRGVVAPRHRVQSAVTIVTGMRCPRACRCRRPNRPMSGEGKCSIRNPSPGCTARRRAGRPCRRRAARRRTRR